MSRTAPATALSFNNDALSRVAHAAFRRRRQRAGAHARTMTLMFSDLDEARAQQAALKMIVERHAGAAPDYRALRRVLDLCRRAAAAVDDRYCRDKLRIVEDSSAELFSQAEARSQFLKQQILGALELFYSRLYSLEVMRRRAAPRPLGSYLA